MKEERKTSRTKIFWNMVCSLNFSERTNFVFGFGSLFASVVALIVAINDVKQDNQLKELQKIAVDVNSQLKMLRADSLTEVSMDSVRMFRMYSDVKDTLLRGYMKREIDAVIKSTSFRQKMIQSIINIRYLHSLQRTNIYIQKDSLLQDFFFTSDRVFYNLAHRLEIYGDKNSPEEENMEIYLILHRLDSFYGWVLVSGQNRDLSFWRDKIDSLNKIGRGEDVENN